jgi:hypothetical protein
MVREGLYEHDLADLLGCTRGSVASWLFYGHRPREGIVKRLIFLSDGELSDAYGAREPRMQGGKQIDLTSLQSVQQVVP